MSKIYTRTGDEGKTGLVSGKRVSKGDDRIDLYGELDELNSRLGLVCSYLDAEKDFKEVSEFLHLVQSAIFDLGSQLACEPENRVKFKLPEIPSSIISSLESEIDRMDSSLEPLKNFILPGGTVVASAIHLCRTSARQIERKYIHFHEATSEEMPLNGGVFLNRLSDYFFVLARYINFKQNGSERLWKPQK